MPTLNPRVSVTLRPELAAIFKRLSELTGNSQSALIGDLLEGSSEVFERMVRLLEAAERLKAEGLAVPAELKRGLDEAQARMEDQLGLAFEAFDAGGAPLLKAAEKVGRRSGRRHRPAEDVDPAAAPSTPLSNRGVTPQGKAVKARAKARGRTPVGA